MADVGELKARVKIDTSDADKKIKGIKKDFKDTGEQVKKSTKDLSESVFFTLGAIEGVGKAVRWTLDHLRGGMDDTLEISKKIDQTRFFSGISAKDFQNVDDALKKMGVNFSAFESTFNTFDSFLYNFKQFGQISQRQGQIYGILGINPQDYDNTIELINAVGNALLKKPEQERRNLAAELGFNADFLWAMSKGLDVLHESLNLTDEAIDKANNLQQKINDLGQRWKKIWRVGYDNYLADHVNNIIGNFETWTTGAEKWVSGSSFSDAFDDIVGQKKGSPSFKESQLSQEQKNTFNTIVRELRRAGVGEAGIAGILGNAYQESSLQGWRSNGSHKGLFQWDKNRYPEMVEYARKNGLSATSDVAQIRFAIEEMKKLGIFDTIAKTKSVDDATILFEKRFERSGKWVNGEYVNPQHLDRRLSAAHVSSGLLSPTGDSFASPLNALANMKTGGTVVNDSHDIVTINTNNDTAENVFDLFKQQKTVAGSVN